MRRFVVVCFDRRGTARARAPPARRPSGGWVRPVPGAVVRPFDPPAVAFRRRPSRRRPRSDRPARRLSRPGRVSCRSPAPLPGRRHVVIAHAGNLRTSYSFLASVAVRRGETVARGRRRRHDRRHGRRPRRAGPALRPALRRHLPRPDDAARSARPHGDRAPRADVGTAASRQRTRRTARPARRPRARGTRGGAHRRRRLHGRGRNAFERTHPIEAAVARGVHEWMAQRDSCQEHAPPANGEGGSEHRVMVVAGIESSPGPNHPPLALPSTSSATRPTRSATSRMRPTAATTTRDDTEGPILVAAHGWPTSCARSNAVTRAARST